VQSILMDKSHEPDAETISRAVGTAGRHWDQLVSWLQEVGAKGSTTWDGDKYGWSLRYRRAGRPFTTLTPLEDAFASLVVLGREQSVEAGSLELSPSSRRTYEEARQYPDGRWLFLHVSSPEQLADVVQLLRLKLPARVRSRSHVTGGAGA